MDDFMKFCEERHRALDEKLAGQARRLDAHAHKIDGLERSDAVNTTQIGNLTRAISNQTRAIWGLVSTIIATLAGFLIWYIQSLG